MADHPLAVAAREINAHAEKRSPEAACKAIGLKLDDLLYVAEQRGYRALYAMRGIGIEFTKDTVLNLQPEDVMLLHNVLIPAYMDALAIGWRGQQIEQERENENTKGDNR